MLRMTEIILRTNIWRATEVNDKDNGIFKGQGGWEGDARGKRYGDICICIADSLCYKAGTNTPLSSNFTPIKMLKNKKSKVLLSI